MEVILVLSAVEHVLRFSEELHFQNGVHQDVGVEIAPSFDSSVSHVE